MKSKTVFLASTIMENGKCRVLWSSIVDLTKMCSVRFWPGTDGHQLYGHKIEFEFEHKQVSYIYHDRNHFDSAIRDIMSALGR